MTEFGITRDYVEHRIDGKPRTEYSAPVILNSLRSLELDSRDYLLIGGASLLLRGIIDTTADIDMLVSDKGFGVLAQKFNATLQDPPPRAILEGAKNRSVHLFSQGVPVTAAASMGNGYYPISFSEHRPKAEFIISGIPFMGLEDVIASKTALARERDIVHLEEIASFLGRSIPIPIAAEIPPPDSFSI